MAGFASLGFVVALVAGAVLGAPAPTSAQRLAYRVASQSEVTHGFVDLATGAATPATEDQAQVGAVFTSDGQFAARRLATGTLSLRHIPSGAQSILAIDFTPRFAHPRRLMLFGTSGFDPARLDERGLVVWRPCGAVPAIQPMDLSIDGRNLFVLCPNGELVGLDSESGAEIRRVAVGAPGGISSFVLGASDAEIVAGRGIDIARIDAITGQTLAARPLGGGVVVFNAGVTSTPARDRVILLECRIGAPGLRCSRSIVDFASLAVVRALPDNSPFSGAFVTPDGREAFVTNSTLLFPYAASVSRIDLLTGATLAHASVPEGWSIAIGYVPVPLPPSAPAASVSGGTVSVTWSLPAHSPAAAGYRLAIGSTPNAANLGSIALGPATSFTATGVPSGRYFVRLHTANYTGESPPSTEIVVDVP